MKRTSRRSHDGDCVISKTVMDGFPDFDIIHDVQNS